MRRLLPCALVLACALLAAPTAPAADVTSPYRGLGAWISLYGKGWADPTGAVTALADRGVGTLYLETGRSTSAAAIERPSQTAEFVDAAHAEGMQVVAWYYPTFRNWRLDAQRTIATASWRTATGGRFDGVAPDIEDPAVRNASLRTRRLKLFTNAIMRAVPRYAWGAITYPPIGLDLNPAAWPSFPWTFVAQRYVAILPMAYWRYRTRTAAGAAWYAAGNVFALRYLTGREDLVVHMIGSGGTTGAEAYAFAQASVDAGAEGVSLYPADSLTTGEWGGLLRALPPSAA
jgi:hypothetical protein